MEKSLEIDQLKNGLKLAKIESIQSQEMLKSDSEILSLEHNCVQEDVQMLKNELSCVNKEREYLLIRIKELEAISELSNDFQNLKDQLHIMTEERDKLMTQIEEQQSHVVEMECPKKNCNDMLSDANVQVEELTGRISSMEVKMHNDEVDNSKEKAKLRMRLRGTQAKLDAFRNRYMEAMKESDLMNRNFEEAAGKLKDQLASKGIEVLNLKKKLASTIGQ
nr:kinesin-like protein kin-7o [Quercus suber]